MRSALCPRRPSELKFPEDDRRESTLRANRFKFAAFASFFCSFSYKNEMYSVLRRLSYLRGTFPCNLHLSRRNVSLNGEFHCQESHGFILEPWHQIRRTKRKRLGKETRDLVLTVMTKLPISKTHRRHGQVVKKRGRTGKRILLFAMFI